jgi:hypothetical protein
MHLRVIYWTAGARMFLDKPVAGHGLGTFPSQYPRYRPPLASKMKYTRTVRPTHPHNEYVRVAVEQGGIGLLLFVGLLATAYTVGYVGLAHRSAQFRLVGYAMWAGALAFAVQAAFGKAPMSWTFSTSWWMMMGIMAGAYGWIPPRGGETGPAPAAEAEDGPCPAERPLKINEFGWVAVVAVTLAVGWYVWTWGVGAYNAMVRMREAEHARKYLSREQTKWGAFANMVEAKKRFRPRCLWPTNTLYYDYVEGWFEATNLRYADGLRHLKDVQDTSPEYLKVRILMALCQRNLGRLHEAAENTIVYLSLNPYDTLAYNELAIVKPPETLDIAIEMLKTHIENRLQWDPNRIVDDYPTAQELKAFVWLCARAGAWDVARSVLAAAHEFFRTHPIPSPEQVDVWAALAELRREYAQTSMATQLPLYFPEITVPGRGTPDTAQ